MVEREELGCGQTAVNHQFKEMRWDNGALKLKRRSGNEWQESTKPLSCFSLLPIYFLLLWVCICSISNWECFGHISWPTFNSSYFCNSQVRPDNISSLRCDLIALCLNFIKYFSCSAPVFLWPAGHSLICKPEKREKGNTQWPISDHWDQDLVNTCSLSSCSGWTILRSILLGSPEGPSRTEPQVPITVTSFIRLLKNCVNT